MSGCSHLSARISSPLQVHDIDVQQLFTIEALDDESDLVPDRNLITGEIIGLREVQEIASGAHRSKAIVSLDTHRAQTRGQCECG